MAQFKQLPLIQYGELHDVDKLNAAIKAVNILMGGGKVTRIDNPILWLNGTTGFSSAYVLPAGDHRIVILSALSVITKVEDTTTIGKLPDSLIPADDDSVRIHMTETCDLAVWDNHGSICKWGHFANDKVGQSGSAVYVTKN